MAEPFLIIWLMDQVNSDNENALHLRTLVANDNLQTYHSWDECIDFITDIKEISMKIYLIISLSSLTEASETLINTAEELSKIDSVYILCSTASFPAISSAADTKIRGIYTDYQSLVNQLLRTMSIERYRYRRFASDDFTVTAMMPLPIVAVTTLQSSSLATNTTTTAKRQEAEFMYSQLARDILVSMESSETEMLEFRRQQYADNEAQLRFIQEFEEYYESCNAIFWYTRDTFLYRLLNKALREQEIDTLYSLRYFIRHLHLQLKDFHSKQLSANTTAENDEIVTVYRGQSIKNEEFERKIRHNLGGFLSVTTFLSTTMVKQLAAVFGGNGSEVDKQSVLFQIDIDQSVNKFPYANISTESVFGEEAGEILFTMGSVFRILSVQSAGTNMWYIHLKLTGEEDEELRNLTEYMKGGLDKFSPEIHLARLLFEMAQYNKAVNYLNIAMQDSQLMEDCIVRVYIYNELGDIYGAIGEGDKSAEYYRKVLEIDLRHLPEHHPALMVAYSIIAVMHKRDGDLEQTLFYYNKMLEISLKHPEETECSDADSDYKNIAVVYKKQKRYSEAMEMCRKALEIQFETLPHNHPSFSTTYQYMSELFAIQKNYEEANQYLQKALEIQKNSLSPDHPDFIKTYKDLCLSYYKLDKFKESLECMKKANELRLKHLPAIKHSNADAANNKFQKRIQEANELLEVIQQREEKSTPADND
ncbi:unnamed protein product [Didymodactylos carnosus]|uniref:Uncharacterized protein n=1 Tax=Didymodactylos carnosus TaxID=1234261 RepID=A0A814TFI9_9BILA|nr:unnamed protein product [Didymodactylos carnosus]CAF1284985.1 unnamed protein product [Didymodactylos carnosus]CAF3922894.1 unnamed protein product [Didymodactylos carnosus]CAF4089965.1 unnamed protein product [Didymodactylos carnosus]